MFAECTIQYDTKKGGDIYVFIEKQILVTLLGYLSGCNDFVCHNCDSAGHELFDGWILPSMLCRVNGQKLLSFEV